MATKTKKDEELPDELTPRVAHLERDVASIQSSMDGLNSAIERQNLEMRETNRAIFAKLETLGKDVSAVSGSGGEMFLSGMSAIREGASLFALVIVGIIWFTSSYESFDTKRLREQSVANIAVMQYQIKELKKVISSDTRRNDRGG